MSDEKPPSTRPVPFSGYLDLILSFLMPFLGISFVLLVGFWALIRPSVADSLLNSWIVGIVGVSAMFGIANAARYYRKAYSK